MAFVVSSTLSTRRLLIRNVRQKIMTLHIIKHPDPNPKPPRNLLSDGLPRASAAMIDEFDIVDSFHRGFHVVLCGYIALTHLSYFFEYALNIKQCDQDRVLRPLIDGNETKTLFPPDRVTIIPFRYDDAAYLSGDAPSNSAKERFSIEEVESHIRKALEIEHTVVKAGKVVFCFLDLQAGMLRYRNLVESILRHDYADSHIECFMWSYDNTEFSTNEPNASNELRSSTTP